MVASSPSRTYLVTGATEGIGLETCKQLQSQGHTVLVHGRNAAKVENVVQSLKEQDSSKAHTGFVYDLSSMAAVREFGADVIRQYPSLDGLLNNAGSFDGDYTGKRKVTEDGNEYTLAVNVLAPFLLTSLLLPSLRAMPGEVVVDKWTFGAFASTDLEAQLRARGVRKIVLAGILTNVCVFATAVQAVDRFFRVCLVEDATGAFAADWHDKAVDLISGPQTAPGHAGKAVGLYFGEVSTVARVTHALGKLAAL